MSYSTVLIEPQAPPPARAQVFSFARLAGIVLMAFWVALFAGLIFSMVTDFDSGKFWKYFPRMVHGLGLTLQLVTTSVVLGAILSLPIAFARMSRSTALSSISYGYVYLFRGTPLITQVFLIYYGLGSFRTQFEAVGLWWFFREAYFCAVLAFTLNTAAYQAEILRGALLSVPRGQTEAARAAQVSDLHPGDPAAGDDGGAPALWQ